MCCSSPPLDGWMVDCCVSHSISLLNQKQNFGIASAVVASVILKCDPHRHNLIIYNPSYVCITIKAREWSVLEYKKSICINVELTSQVFLSINWKATFCHSFRSRCFCDTQVWFPSLKPHHLQRTPIIHHSKSSLSIITPPYSVHHTTIKYSIPPSPMQNFLQFRRIHQPIDPPTL